MFCLDFELLLLSADIFYFLFGIVKLFAEELQMPLKLVVEDVLDLLLALAPDSHRSIELLRKLVIVHSQESLVILIVAAIFLELAHPIVLFV